ncbi:hypothetical protein [Kitasatospora atroaurantiaca]|uniref:Uncharacterized protein n=1 Tax=Kitasatospora atroaurantiaca TaxID=285545 RepID=A0A561EKS1_9ACTN|nr:hypothetical protein [Kitasatospora atroaurantiaca]TWE16225.1 hypothetical protein FB465_1196 [Kitasatospora atroaurantiaca]
MAVYLQLESRRASARTLPPDQANRYRGYKVIRRASSGADRDGGYHAIKGYAFQFDASLLQILDNHTGSVEIEGAQDIGVRNFHIQVKNRSARFSLRSITNPVLQMMDQFSQNRDARFSLYCHFLDRAPGSVIMINRDELDSLLGEKSSLYEEDAKEMFTKSFQINFAPDYRTQFETVLSRLTKVLRARSESEATYWHAVIHGHLRDLIFSQPQGERRVNLQQLIDVVNDARSAVFEASYAQVYGHTKYLKLLRDQYKSRGVNVHNRQRLFVVECSVGTHLQDLVDVAARIRSRYYAGQSPAPYLCFRGVRDLVDVKRALWDADLKFDDGFNYGGAQFSVVDLVTPPSRGFGIKLVDFALLPEVTVLARYREVHDFYLTDPVSDPDRTARTQHVFIEQVADIQKILG